MTNTKGPFPGQTYYVNPSGALCYTQSIHEVADGLIAGFSNHAGEGDGTAGTLEFTGFGGVGWTACPRGNNYLVFANVSSVTESGCTPFTAQTRVAG